ncbi:hypothetical protein FQA47_020001 [Oryzias melastigma]|uniref:Uncharacterized protein n=1 Tax=Oryzias melastigma TaxID=30732 RepID=A0A834FKG7_ORYME|nr:hypothetical protein FQA47_020001 [Oryzias melastigma]
MLTKMSLQTHINPETTQTKKKTTFKMGTEGKRTDTDTAMETKSKHERPSFFQRSAAAPLTLISLLLSKNEQSHHLKILCFTERWDIRSIQPSLVCIFTTFGTVDELPPMRTPGMLFKMRKNSFGKMKRFT